MLLVVCGMWRATASYRGSEKSATSHMRGGAVQGSPEKVAVLEARV